MPARWHSIHWHAFSPCIFLPELEGNRCSLRRIRNLSFSCKVGLTASSLDEEEEWRKYGRKMGGSNQEPWRTHTCQSRSRTMPVTKPSRVTTQLSESIPQPQRLEAALNVYCTRKLQRDFQGITKSGHLGLILDNIGMQWFLPALSGSSLPACNALLITVAQSADPRSTSVPTNLRILCKF